MNGASYGQGLYALAKDEQLEGRILEELSALAEGFAGEPDFLKLLSAHNLPLTERRDILDASFRTRVHPYTLNFLKLLTDKGYIRDFAAALKAFRDAYNADRGIIEVRAISAIALTDSQKSRLTEKLSALTGKEVRLTNRVAPTVLGGVLLRYDGKQIDGTLRGRLDALSKVLKNTVL